MLGKVFINAFAAVQTAKLMLIYNAIVFVKRNILPDTADSESKGGTLERFGLLKLGRLPFPAEAGEYNIRVSGSVGAIIPTGTTFKSLDGSTSPDKLFVLDDPFEFTSSPATIKVRALDLGPEARLEVGDGLQLTAPISNVDSYQEVVTVEQSPTERESEDDYRDKTIESYRTEPQGGAKTDYKLWAIDATGVRRAYPYIKDGSAGTVQVYVEANPADSTDGNGTPTPAILSDVSDVIEFDPDTTQPIEERGRRPMTAIVETLAINPVSVDVDIVNLSDPLLLTSIGDAIKDLLFDIRPFIDGADDPNNRNDKLYEADIYGVVRDVIGPAESFDSLNMTVDSSSVDIYTFERENIPFLDNLTTS